MTDVLRRHLDAIAATSQLLLAQIDAARHALTLADPATPAPATAPEAPTLPAACLSTREDECAKRTSEAVRELMGGQRICVGCGCFAAVAALTD